MKPLLANRLDYYCDAVKALQQKITGVQTFDRLIVQPVTANLQPTSRLKNAAQSDSRSRVSFSRRWVDQMER